jgi:peptide chain release factor 2
MAKDNFWDEPDKAAVLLKERTQINDELAQIKSLQSQLEDVGVLFEMAHEEQDEATQDEALAALAKIERDMQKLSLDQLLSGQDDHRNAIVSINAGAGGTDAQDWAEILMRMYLRWVEQKAFKSEIIDLAQGDEAGIKSVTFSVDGPYAYGYLKLEEGVHRLVRISPFNASGKRHTSFASVSVYPQVDQEIAIEILDKDLRVDTFRASGAGGQHVNKTSSAVRLTHLPTNIVVSCQQEKSQHRNREMAMKVLKARLYQKEQEKQQKQMQDLYESKDEIGWGSQIRSYVLQPYQMVKDHRINMEIGNVQSVLDGNLDSFMEGVLLASR